MAAVGGWEQRLLCQRALHCWLGRTRCLSLLSDLTSLHAQVREYISKKVLPEEAPARKLLDRGGEGLVSSQHQWQFNLLTHVESLQDEVTHRMDSIEKELDGRFLSWHHS